MMLSRLKHDLTMAEAARAPGGSRVDLVVVAEMVEPGAKVLDVGCGDGELLRLLADTRGVDGRGIELSREGVNECVAKGLAVIQGDADTDLADYPDHAFDYVVLSQTLQATRQPRIVLEHMLRIGRHGIVSFPNFGHWRIRLQILLGGRMPRTDNLPYAWCDSPNIHFCTIKDFRQLCHVVGARMEKSVALQRAVVDVEPARRAGRVPAQPARDERNERRCALDASSALNRGALARARACFWRRRVSARLSCRDRPRAQCPRPPPPRHRSRNRHGRSFAAACRGLTDRACRYRDRRWSPHSARWA